jgi:hypothetical protein
MNFKSKQFIFALLAGIAIGLLASIFLKPMCWGVIAGVIVAAYFAKVSSPKDGAIVGAIVLVPISAYAFTLAAIQSNASEKLGALGSVLVFFLTVILASGIGALFGLVVGKLFQVTKGKGIIF